MAKLVPRKMLTVEGMVLPVVESVNDPSAVGVKVYQIEPESEPSDELGSFCSSDALALFVDVV